MGKVISFLSRLWNAERFMPDIAVADGYSLIEFGLDAKVLPILGHSKESIEILAANGVLLAGDFLQTRISQG